MVEPTTTKDDNLLNVDEVHSPTTPGNELEIQIHEEVVDEVTCDANGGEDPSDETKQKSP